MPPSSGEEAGPVEPAALVAYGTVSVVRPGDPALQHAAGQGALGAGDRTAAEAHLQRASGSRYRPGV